MKKTRTLTFHFPINNGAFLQAYALQQVILKECNADNEIIDYREPKQEAIYSIFQPIKSKSDIIKNAFSLLHYNKLRKRQQSFYRMQKDFLKTTEKVIDEKGVYELAEEADLNIVGSDQVWNTSISACTPAFFLQNVKAKKITYAASMGSHAKLDLIKDYVDDIASFDALGIREPALKPVLDFFDKEKTVVLDPTILLKKEDYQPLYNSKSFKKKYIMLYSMRFSKQLLETVKRISKAFGLPVYVPFTTYKAIKCLKYGFKLIYDASPDVFLNLIDNAELVLTNSFHGTAFSVIFQKNFFHICDIKDNLVVRDDRIDDLLDGLNIKRNVNINTDVSEIINAQKIPYDNVEVLLESLCAKSIDFLKRHIN